MSIAVRAAKYNNASAGFDFEDYHRGENANTPEHELKRLVYLEETYVPALSYISVSSPLITKMVEQHFPSFSKPVITLVNSFPLSQQPPFRHKPTDDFTLRLFWFSQTIGKDRGLEALIEALEKLDDANIYLTLAGRCNDDMKEYIHQHAVKVLKNIEFAGIKQPEDLSAFAAGFDVGLALETGFSINNGISLTNKIFTYLLAGNAVILSNTPMQELFNNKYNVGEIFTPYDSDGLAKKILLFKNRNKLDAQRLHNYELSQNELNWDNESKKLLTIFS